MSKNSPVALSAQMVYVADPEPVIGKAPESNSTKEEEKGNNAEAKVQIAAKAPTKALPNPPLPVDVVSANAGVKLPSLDPVWTKRMNAMKALLVERGLKSEAILFPLSPDVDTNAETMKGAFTEVELFGLDKSELMEKDSMLGLALIQAIPVHIYGLTVMITGKTTRADFHKRLHTEWIDVIKHVTNITGNVSAFTSTVLETILKNHMKDCARMYYILVHCSESAWLCKTKAALMLDWVRRLKGHADTYWGKQKDMLTIQIVRRVIKFSGTTESETANDASAENPDEFSED
jgi:hypothetical protein